MEMKVVICDCGCGKKSESLFFPSNWFHLSQPQQKHDCSDPKLERTFHFATIGCLDRWVKKDAPICGRMAKSYWDQPHPRGGYFDGELPDIIF